MNNQANQKPAKQMPGNGQFIRKEKVPLTLSATHVSDVKVSNKGLKGKPIVLVISDGEYTRQMTFHHPIGKHYLSSGDWIVTPTGDVQTFLNASEDPSQEAKFDARKKIRQELGVKFGIYKTDPDTKALSFAKNGKTFADAAKEQDALFDDAKKAAFEKYLEECKLHNRDPKPDWKFGEPRWKFRPKWVTEIEDDLETKITGDRKAALQEKLSGGAPFATKGGPTGELFQRRVKFGNNLESGPFIDELYKFVLKEFASPPGEAPPDYVRAKQSFNEIVKEWNELVAPSKTSTPDSKKQ